MAKGRTKKRGESSADKRLERMRERIHAAESALNSTVFGRLLDYVSVHICEGVEGEPKPLFACVDGDHGLVFANPFVTAHNELSEPEWRYVLAHQLAHLALNHCEGSKIRHAAPWNIACCCAADSLLRALQI